MTKRLTLLIRANNKNSKRCMTARSAILVQCANGTLHTAELGCFPLQSRALRLHEVIGTQQVANERIRPNDGHAQRKSHASHALACGTTVSRRIWSLPGAANHTRCIFFNHNAITAKGFKHNRQTKIVSPAVMAKLAFDRASIVSCKKNREIFIPNREIGRFSLFYQKSGDLPQNRETWKLCETVFFEVELREL